MEIADIPLILPAAGKSSRVGSPKGLQQHAQRTWLEIQCRFYAEAGGGTVVLVLGYDSDRYLDALGCTVTGQSDTLYCGGCSLQLLQNPLPEFGPFSSLAQAGLWIERATDYQAAFFLPIDTPVPSAVVLQNLARAQRSGIHVVQPRYENRGGHPVLLSRDFLRELTTLDHTLPESRLDRQIRRQHESGAVIGVAVTDVCVVLNLNDPAAWEQYFKSERRFDLATSLLTMPSSQ